MQLGPARDVAAPAARAAHAAVVVGPGLDAGRAQLVADVLVAAGVLAQAVDQQDRGPRRAGPRTARPPTSSAGQCRTSRSVPSAAATWLTIDGIGAAYATDGPRSDTAATIVRWVSATAGSRSAIASSSVATRSTTRTSGSILGDGESLVIDTRSTHVQAREILADLRELTRDPVTVVVDTHGHFDHAYGNHVFRPATIWGHDGCVTFIERTGEERRDRDRRRGAGPRRRPRARSSSTRRTGPSPRRATIEVGGRAVELAYLGSRPHRPRHRHRRARTRTSCSPAT